MKTRQTDFVSVLIWTLSKISLFLFSYLSIWLLSDREAKDLIFRESLNKFWNLSIWNNWDVAWYLSVAENGYFVSPTETNIAFFPGHPILIKTLSLSSLNSIQSGFLVTFISGIFASIFLNRLAVKSGDINHNSLFAWVMAPSAIFLFIPYSEALFCAFSFAAWYFGKQNKWIYAGVFALFASTVIINGIFLTLALITMLLSSNRRQLQSVIPLLLGFVPSLVFFSYLRYKFGNWLIWFEVQEKFWQRKFTNPITSLQNSLERANLYAFDSSWLIQVRFEIICVLILIIITFYFFFKKQWAEFVYLFLTLAALMTSTFWWTAPRTLLALIPIWLIVGKVLSKNQILKMLYFLISMPILLLNVLSFMMGRSVN